MDNVNFDIFDFDPSSYFDAPKSASDFDEQELATRNIRVLKRGDLSLIIVRTNYQGTVEERKEFLYALVDHQQKINSRLRNLGLHGILVDIIDYRISIAVEAEYIICKSMRLVQESSFEQNQLGIANCLSLYIGLDLKGVDECIIIGVRDLKLAKILPFTYLNNKLAEKNQKIIIFQDKLVKFKPLNTLSDIQMFKYIELNYGLTFIELLKKCKVQMLDEHTKFLNQNDEVFAWSNGVDFYKEEIYFQFYVGGQKYEMAAFWESDNKLINQRINGQNFDDIPEELFDTINSSILSEYNLFTFKYEKSSLIYLDCSVQGDLKNKKITIDPAIKRQQWYLSLCSILKMLNMHILNLTYQSQKLFLRTLCKLNFSIPIFSLEIEADIREEDFNLILDQCNTNPYIECLNIEGSNFRDTLFQGLTTGGFLRGIKELNCRGCPFITDEGLSLLTNFGLQKLDLSQTNVQHCLPQGLLHLNIAYSKIDEQTICQIFKLKHSVHLDTLDISGIATDRLLQAIFNSHYKDLRNLYANNSNLSLQIFKFINESKHVRNLQVLSLQGSLVEVQESIFKKNYYQLLGSSKSMILKLDFANCQISDKLVQSLVEGQRVLSNLRVLSLSGCKQVSDKSVQMLCDAPTVITQNLKHLDISNLPLITEYSIEYLVYKGLKGLTDLNIANCQQLKVEDLKKAFESGKFNQLKSLSISGINEWGGQAEVFSFGIPELCSFFIQNHLSELQFIEIYVQNRTFKNIIKVVLNLIQSHILTKIICQEEINFDDETMQLIQQNGGTERLLINNKPVQMRDRTNGNLQKTQGIYEFYENLFKRQSDLRIIQQDIKYIRLICNFKRLRRINVSQTEINDNDLSEISSHLDLHELKIKKCKSLTFASLLTLQLQQKSLQSLDFRGCVFERNFETLKTLATFQNLQKLNNGKLKVTIINKDKFKYVGKELAHLPQLLMQLDSIKSFKLQIKTKQIQTFEFLFRTLSVLLNKNQDQIKQLKIELYHFKLMIDKPIQLFNNSILNLHNLQDLNFGFENVKNVNFQLIKYTILSISSLQNLKSLTLHLNKCVVQDLDQEVMQENVVFEDLRGSKLRRFSLLANDAVTSNPQVFGYLFQYLEEMDALLHVRLEFARHQIPQEFIQHICDSLKNIQLHSLILNFEQSAISIYNRESLSRVLEVIRSQSILNTLELNFSHDFKLVEMDILNLIEGLYSLKLQQCAVSMIGCYSNERKVANMVKEEMKNYYLYI